MFSTLEEKSKHEWPKQFYSELQIEMASRYSNWLRELGTPQEFTDLWKDLIMMRTDEYRQDYQHHTQELEKEWKKNPWVFVCAMGGYHHLRRGKGKPEDPLFKLFLNWVVMMGNVISDTIVNVVG